MTHMFSNSFDKINIDQSNLVCTFCLCVVSSYTKDLAIYQVKKLCDSLWGQGKV